MAHGGGSAGRAAVWGGEVNKVVVWQNRPTAVCTSGICIHDDIINAYSGDSESWWHDQVPKSRFRTFAGFQVCHKQN